MGFLCLMHPVRVSVYFRIVPRHFYNLIRHIFFRVAWNDCSRCRIRRIKRGPGTPLLDVQYRLSVRSL